MPAKKDPMPPIEDFIPEPEEPTLPLETALHLPDGTAHKWEWPESVQTEELLVSFDESDRSAIANQMGELIEEHKKLESEENGLKSQIKGIKADMKDIDIKLKKYSTSLKEGGDKREVECTWHFETSGVDKDSGELIAHPEYKTLVRDDTGEQVRVERITDEERQATLRLPVEASTEYEVPEDDEDEDEEENEDEA